jgi:sarcosine oxidase subunit delta
MLLIPCPFCGNRNEDEFICGGDADRIRPQNPEVLTDHEWQDYLYNNTNTKGWVRERWWHVKGCGSWFEINRNNVTHEIRELNLSSKS